ncbi:MAG: hypothetical protein A2020_15175 [Lentisphaerae bacterium GWF2_45_14]|nr:MAG: hypothetical protein A2020_15175 [Lentisphaerae bacterium GWF2_45_14]
MKRQIAIVSLFLFMCYSSNGENINWTVFCQHWIPDKRADMVFMYFGNKEKTVHNWICIIWDRNDESLISRHYTINSTYNLAVYDHRELFLVSFFKDIVNFNGKFLIGGKLVTTYNYIFNIENGRVLHVTKNYEIIQIKSHDNELPKSEFSPTCNAWEIVFPYINSLLKEKRLQLEQ